MPMEKNPAETHKAFLVRGTSYHLGKKRFDKNQPVLVTEEEMEHLKETAIDVLTTEGEDGSRESVERQKFRFEPIDAEEEEPASSAPRARASARGRG